LDPLHSPLATDPDGDTTFEPEPDPKKLQTKKIKTQTLATIIYIHAHNHFNQFPKMYFIIYFASPLSMLLLVCRLFRRTAPNSLVPDIFQNEKVNRKLLKVSKDTDQVTQYSIP
jgi:hypothetical protein